MPEIALIGVGKDNSFGHPSDGTIERLNKIKCKILRTDENGEIEMFLDFNEIMEQKPVVTNSLASQGPLLEFFRFLDRKRDLAKVMIGPHGDLAFVNRLKDQIEKRTLQVLESAQSDANYEYLCSFIITGCVGVVETWLKESDPQSPEEMAEILGAMLLRQLNFAPGPA